MEFQRNSDALKHLKAGSLIAFEKLLYSYEKGIFNHLYRLTGSREDAEDLTQEVFLKLYKNRTLIDPARNFKSWLYTVATNTAYDWLRRKNRYQEIPLEICQEGNVGLNPASTYYRINYQLEQTMEVALILDKLSPLYATVLTLFYREGLSYKEIARILGAPLNTTKTYLRRAKGTFRKEIGEEYVSR